MIDAKRGLKCQACGNKYKTTHHTKPSLKRSEDDCGRRGKLLRLCRLCHKKIHILPNDILNQMSPIEQINFIKKRLK